MVRWDTYFIVNVFFLIFFRVLLPWAGKLLKFRPRESESESDSSTYTKSEVFAEETSEKEFDSFKLGEEELKEEFRSVSISIGWDDEVVNSKLGLSGIVQTQSGLHARQTKGMLSFSSK